MDPELRVNKVAEVFPMTAVCQWLSKYKTAKILNILTEVDFCLEVARILRLVLTKTTIYMQHLVLLLRNSLTLRLE